MTETPSSGVQKENLLIQITAVEDILSELRVQIEKVFGSRDDVPESLTCDSCDAQVDSIAEAVLAGWENITPDDGLSWNFLGTCRACIEADQTEADRMNAEYNRKQLTNSQVWGEDEPTELPKPQSTKDTRPNTLFPTE